jgi:hypothetical protein|tara:strand:- start:197 stop:946 length:750 start_codon:yes stop_codon:yes gene_type:complete
VRLRAIVLPVLGSVLSLTLLAAPVGAADEPVEPDPMAGAPAIGTCADMDWDDVMGETATQDVDCERRHTTEVVGVGQLPDDLSWDQRRQVGKAVVAGCAPAWETVTTDDHLLYRRSAYVKFWFMPSQEQREAGARWFRCDLARVKGKQLMSTTGAGLPEVTERRMKRSVQRCMTKDFYGTVCKNKRRLVAWRSKSSFWLSVPAKDSRAEKKVRRVALDRCPEKVRTASFAWSWFTDKNRRWVVVCYEKF